MQKNLILILIFCMTAFSQEVVKMNSKPMKDDGVEFKEIKTIMDEEDGFYDRTIASISPDGKIVIADAGNKLIFVYDNNYKLIKKFGKEGNGPGEIDRIADVNATANRIFVSSFRRMIIFKYDGSFVNEVNLFQYGSSRQIYSEDGITLYYTVGNPKYRTVSYDNNGKEISKMNNTEYVKPKEEQGGMRMMIFSGNGYVPYHGGYINSARGEYGIEYIRSDFNVEKKYVREFTRIPRNMDNFQFSFKAEGASKKQQEKMRQAAQKQMLQQLGKFEDDVAGILGIFNDYIFARTASGDNKVIMIDVISPDMKYVTTVKLEGDEYESARIEHGKLIVNYKNDDDGPYVKIYDINMI